MIPVEKRPIGLRRQEIVATTLDNLFGNIGLGPHGIDGDERPGQLQPFEQMRNGDDLIWTCRRPPPGQAQGADASPRQRPDAAALASCGGRAFAVISRAHSDAEEIGVLR